MTDYPSFNAVQPARRKIPTRMPRWNEIAPMIFSGPPELNARVRRLKNAQDLEDIRKIARRRTPASVFDYVDGSAETETADRRNREAFRQIELLPRILRDVGSVDTSCDILGRKAALPLIFAPTGFTRMMQYEGEIAVGRVAERGRIPYARSTMGTTSPRGAGA